MYFEEHGVPVLIFDQSRLYLVSYVSVSKDDSRSYMWKYVRELRGYVALIQAKPV